MLKSVTRKQVQHVIEMCEKHVSDLPEDLRGGHRDLWSQDSDRLTPEAKAVRAFHAVLSTHIGNLSDKAQIELLALFMVGRHPHDFKTFAEATDEAREEFDEKTPDFLADKQLVLAGFLRNGLQQLSLGAPRGSHRPKE